LLSDAGAADMLARGNSLVTDARALKGGKVSAFWIASYILLWALVIVLAAMMLALMRLFGAARVPSRGSAREADHEHHEDGPEIGSALPQLALTPMDGREPFRLGGNAHRGAELLMFLSPLCEGCHLIADALNTVASERANELKLVAFMRGPPHAARAALGVYPLHLPVVLDEEMELNHLFQVRHAPFGLLYDHRGRLVRRGTVVNASDLAALLGDASAPEGSLMKVFPRPA
jgi:methylamine dehydrogenase accessory protein MauD